MTSRPPNSRAASGHLSRRRNVGCLPRIPRDSPAEAFSLTGAGVNSGKGPPASKSARTRRSRQKTLSSLSAPKEVSASTITGRWFAAPAVGGLNSGVFRRSPENLMPQCLLLCSPPSCFVRGRAEARCGQGARRRRQGVQRRRRSEGAARPAYERLSEGTAVARPGVRSCRRSAGTMARIVGDPGVDSRGGQEVCFSCSGREVLPSSSGWSWMMRGRVRPGCAFNADVPG